VLANHTARHRAVELENCVRQLLGHSPADESAARNSGLRQPDPVQ
jgi:hypothetical protein